jgi:predicted glycoside hydrolase/deacetylase ChbG (UPF0249 family)
LERAVRTLVINADDLGIDLRRDAGIFELMDAGAVTQSSLLVRGRNARAAASRARAAGQELGLHLDLTETDPSAPKDEIATLLDRDGKKLGKHGLREAADRVDLAHVAREAEAQIALFVELVGKKPTHVDGHQHVHVVPRFVETLAEVFQRAGIKTTRIPEQPMGEDAPDFYRQVSEHAAAARGIYARFGIASTDSFVGLDLMGDASDGERLREAVLAARGSVEVMVHPGYVGSGWDDFNESPAREHELRVLLARPLHALEGVTLGTFTSIGRTL